MARSYFVVEGIQEVEALGRLLKVAGFARVTQIDALDGYWHALVPRTFPIAGDLNKRVPIPAFYAKGHDSVAIHAAGGIDRVAPTTAATLTTLEEPPRGVGIIVDADYDEDALDGWRRVAAQLELDVGAAPGDIGGSAPRAGVYIIPDNASQGSLEDILLDTAAEAYPQLLHAAREWVQQIDPTDETVFINSAERGDFIKPGGRKKAIIASIAAVLRPGKAIQVSIQDNQWFKNQNALKVTRVRALQAFVNRIIAE